MSGTSFKIDLKCILFQGGYVTRRVAVCDRAVRMSDRVFAMAESGPRRPSLQPFSFLAWEQWCAYANPPAETLQTPVFEGPTLS